MDKNDRSLAVAVHRWGRRTDGLAQNAAAKAEEPSSYEQVTRRGLDDLTRQVDRIETKLNTILFAIAGSLLIDLYRAIVR